MNTKERCKNMSSIRVQDKQNWVYVKKRQEKKKKRERKRRSDGRSDKDSLVSGTVYYVRATSIAPRRRLEKKERDWLGSWKNINHPGWDGLPPFVGTRQHWMRLQTTYPWPLQIVPCRSSPLETGANENFLCSQMRMVASAYWRKKNSTGVREPDNSSKLIRESLNTQLLSNRWLA